VRVRGQRRDQRRFVLRLVHGERAVRPQSLAILVFGLDEVGALESADDRERDLQRDAPA
jgi:hypothetical protein